MVFFIVSVIRSLLFTLTAIANVDLLVVASATGRKCVARSSVTGVVPYPTAVVEKSAVLHRGSGKSMEHCMAACCKHTAPSPCTMAWIYKEKCRLITCELSTCGYRLVNDVHYRDLTEISVISRGQTALCDVEEQTGCGNHEVCAETRSQIRICLCGQGYARTVKGNCVPQFDGDSSRHGGGVGSESTSPTIIGKPFGITGLELAAPTFTTVVVISEHPTKGAGGGKADQTPATKLNTKALSVATAATLPVKHVEVSAGKNQDITLPRNWVTLFSTIWPMPDDLSEYKFTWTLVAGADAGKIINPHAPKAKLSQLKVGTYTIGLEVTGPDNWRGESFVNITVHPVPRHNLPPVAVISPNNGNVEIRLPTSSVVLDASQSHDDFDQKLSYLWEEVVWPINDRLEEKEKTSPVLHFSGFEAGMYRLKLTVTDSDGAQSSALANITVLPEINFRPKAIAGEPRVIQLPINAIWLNGNRSTDDKGIVKYTWRKVKGPDGEDKTGSSSPYLHLSNLRVGEYQYELTVEDAGGKKDKSSTTVLVQPESQQPPQVDAGNDHDLRLPDDSVELKAVAWVEKKSDGCLGCTYAWKKLQFPEGDKSAMTGNDTLTLHVTHLQAGKYVFGLVATGPKGKDGHGQVTVNVIHYVNKAPVANAGPDRVLTLPESMVQLDGRQSFDPDGSIVSYSWQRSLESPAAGTVANHSDSEAVLQLSGLVEGVYQFTLTVKDLSGSTSTDSAFITVHPVDQAVHNGLFEVALKKNSSSFSENEKAVFLQHLANILGFSNQKNVHVFAVETRLTVVVLVLYVVEMGKPRPALSVLKQLKGKTLDVSVSHEGQLIQVSVDYIDTYYCLNNCSGHGRCNPLTKMCICDMFWTEDFFKARHGNQSRNCDWNVLYVVLVGLLVVTALILVCVFIRCLCNRRRLMPSHHRRPGGKRHRYALLRNRDAEEENIAMIPKGHQSSIIQSDSDEDVLFDTSRSSRRTNKGRHTNGNVPHSY